jgi:hypothetical protein
MMDHQKARTKITEDHRSKQTSKLPTTALTKAGSEAELLTEALDEAKTPVLHVPWQ